MYPDRVLLSIIRVKVIFLNSRLGGVLFSSGCPWLEKTSILIGYVGNCTATKVSSERAGEEGASSVIVRRAKISFITISLAKLSCEHRYLDKCMSFFLIFVYFVSQCCQVSDLLIFSLNRIVFRLPLLSSCYISAFFKVRIKYCLLPFSLPLECG